LKSKEDAGDAASTYSGPIFPVQPMLVVFHIYQDTTS
jgi:hypothetical protein